MEIISRSKEVKIESLKNWNENPRAIETKDLERLMRQIKELGIYKPLICEQIKNKYIVIGGNMRLTALNEIGFKSVWITVVKFRSNAERIKLSLSDNDRAGYYVADILAEQLNKIRNEINLDDYKVDIDVPNIDLNNILSMEKTIKEKEITDENLKTSNECPKCGYEW